MDGLFQTELQTNYSPAQLCFPYFVLTDTFGKAEKEEAAARLLYFSKKQGEWVGVSWKVMGQMLINAFEGKEEVETSMTSFVQLYGLDAITNAFHDLIQAGYVEHKKKGNEDILFPTSKLTEAAAKFVA